MKRDLDREKGSIMTLWKKREAQIERVTVNMSGMVGELQAIASQSLPQLESIDLLTLPGTEEVVEPTRNSSRPNHPVCGDVLKIRENAQPTAAQGWKIGALCQNRYNLTANFGLDPFYSGG